MALIGRRLEEIASPVQNLVLAKRLRALCFVAERPDHHHVTRSDLTPNRDLRREKTRGQEAADRRPLLSRVTSDQDLQDGADARAGRIAIAAFLERPLARRSLALVLSLCAHHDVRCRRRAFLRDKEMEFACAGGPEARKQTL